MKYLYGILAIICVISTILIIAKPIFYNKYKTDVKSALGQMSPVPPEIITEESISKLPEPVKRYIRYTGALGKPIVRNMMITFTGQIRGAESSPWMEFTTEQYNFQELSWRLFFMKAKMKGLPVAGYHSFKNGTASMDIRLLSLARVQYQDGEKMGIAETVTFFNDMCCMAPGSLTDKRIEWIESEGNAVKAAFTNNNIRISATLYFNDKGELTNFISNDRYALEEGGKLSRVTWMTPLFDYREINGMRLASRAELIYQYTTGDFCYGRFRMDSIMYNVKK